MPSSITKDQTKPKYCPGTGQKADKRTRNTITKWSPSQYRYVKVDKYKCPHCLKHMSLDNKGHIYRHNPPPSSEELETKRIEEQRILAAKELEKKRKAGQIYGLCAECLTPMLEADYLCSECRK